MVLYQVCSNYPPGVNFTKNYIGKTFATLTFNDLDPVTYLEFLKLRLSSLDHVYKFTCGFEISKLSVSILCPTDVDVETNAAASLQPTPNTGETDAVPSPQPTPDTGETDAAPSQSQVT